MPFQHHQRFKRHQRVVHHGPRDLSSWRCYLVEIERSTNRLARDCQFIRLSSINLHAVERWLVARKAEGMSASTRNAYAEALTGFCNWAVVNRRLSTSPLTQLAEADEKSDRRRQRRAMAESELLTLLRVARIRPLAEFGRESCSRRFCKRSHNAIILSAITSKCLIARSRGDDVCLLPISNAITENADDCLPSLEPA